jgi:murein DD-endopeptidase MepM/ murein hydrolase activator NlpD
MRDYNALKSDEPPSGFDPLILLIFLKSFVFYLVFKTRQSFFFLGAFIISMFSGFLGLKDWSVQRMFWGRGSLYKTAIHLFVGIFTLAITVTGLTSRLNLFGERSEGLVLASGIIGSNDILLQEGTVESIVPSDPNQLGLQVFKHTVKRGETLSGIAAEYGISSATIKWANNISPFSDNLTVSQVLEIPEIDGVLYTVKSGDTLSKVATNNNGNQIDIIELNNLEGPDYALTVGQRLFVPNGSIDPPVVRTLPPPVQTPGLYTPPSTVVPTGGWVRPLPSWCGTWSRGYTYYHRGVDLPQPGGCWIRASKSGVVVVAGWRGAGQGFMVEIDHGGGFSTRYYHGNGNYRVRQGDSVAAGQDIMYMGCTGYCYGTHLHFEVVVNGVRVNPESYVPGLR